MRRLRALGAILIAVLLVVLGTYKLMNSRSFQVAGRLLSHIDTDDKIVALTFDDGPTMADLDAVLEPLAQRGVHATFFVTGAGLEATPEAGRRLVEDGHELANHSWNHPRMVLMSQREIAAQVEPTDAAIRAAGQQGDLLFRPPHGKKLIGLPRYLAAHDRTTIMWDVAPEDFGSDAATQTPDDIVDAVLADVHPGSIILLHPWSHRTTTQQAIGPLIDRLEADGYRFVTVSEAIGG